VKTNSVVCLSSRPEAYPIIISYSTDIGDHSGNHDGKIDN